MTNVTEVHAQVRTVTGKTSHRLAAEGLIPAVVYGPKIETQSLALDRHEFELLAQHIAVGSTLLDLSIDGGKALDVIIKEIKRDEIKGTIKHVDFWAVDMGQTLQTAIAITFVGSSEGERAGGVMNHSLREVKVEARPKDLPEHIEVDVSALNIGESLTVADLVVPKGVTVLDEPETAVASVMPPSVEAEETGEAGEMAEVPEVGKESATEGEG